MRYDRQTILKGFGTEAQNKLSKAKVLVIGAGGLGHPVLQYLCAAGVGTLGVIDYDIVSVSNLHRQVIFKTSDVGKPKLEIIARELSAQNPDVELKTYHVKLAPNNALKILIDYDVIIDCTDNFEVRYLINDLCYLLKKPLVFGAIYQFEGQVSVFNIEDKNGNICSYRDLFPTPPAAHQVPTCNQAGVLGVLPGIIGIFQATEAIKIITEIGSPLINQIYTYNLLDHSNIILNITPNPIAAEHQPQTIEEILTKDYTASCNLNFVEEIHPNDIEQFLKQPSTLLIDVREIEEKNLNLYQNIKIPLSQLEIKVPDIEEKNLIFICQSGKRSSRAAQLFKNKFGENKTIKHIRGGINSLIKQQQ